ncbi:hypothetical protein Ancab_019205 [Ancistrocladus abbreviatus]
MQGLAVSLLGMCLLTGRVAGRWGSSVPFAWAGSRLILMRGDVRYPLYGPLFPRILLPMAVAVRPPSPAVVAIVEDGLVVQPLLAKPF